MYTKIKDGIAIYPYSDAQLRQDNPNTSFPKNLNDSALVEYDVYPVTIDDAPPFNESTQRVVQNTAPELINGSWVIGQTVIDLTAEELTVRAQATIKGYEAAVSNHLDTVVAERGYGDIVSATSYAGYSNPFQAEGIAAGEWRAAVWQACYAILADVEAGNRTAPTKDELIAELPTISWPA